jgi:hypothetical protein
MSRSRKFAPFALACALLLAFGLTLASSNAAQLGTQQAAVAQPVAARPAFDQKGNRAPNFGTQRIIGMTNSLNNEKNISKGISPDG